MDVYNEFVKRSQIKKFPFSVRTLVKATGCNGLCEKGPLVKILPDNISYCRVKASDVEEIVKTTLMKGRTVERLLFVEPSTGKIVRSHRDTEFYRRQMKAALRNIGEIDPASIEDYMERGGYSALKKALFEMKRQSIIPEIVKSNLRGRGGAGFPTGRKWKQCASIDSFPKYVVCNGDEGDPGAFMDRSIMEGDPNSIIEGMAICAYAIGASQGFAYIRDEYSLALKNMQTAIDHAKKYGFLGKNILESGFDFDIQIVRGGGAFVCGESTALMSSIEGKVGEPRAKYIHSTEKGLWGQPTVLNNVETWANIPEIINKGAEWFTSMGTENSPGTKVFSLVGKVKNTGLVEVPMGTTIRELIFDIGGGIEEGRTFKGVQTGGPSGGCIPANLLDLKVDFDSLSEAGSMMGSGGMIVMDDSTCMVEVARYYTKFLSEESCGKCIPCREGIKRMLEILTDICEGRGREDDLDMLTDICGTLSEASLCALGKTAPNPVMTTLKYFRDEYMEHIINKRCPAGVCRSLASYVIDSELCKGCGVCKKGCPAGAISGEIKKAHSIDTSKCIKCGSCVDKCKFHAVKAV
jgi:NADH-quinone oxidoreductase subunit F